MSKQLSTEANKFLDEAAKLLVSLLRENGVGGELPLFPGIRLACELIAGAAVVHAYDREIKKAAAEILENSSEEDSH